MAPLKIQNFGGMIPIQDARLLPDNFASFAQNCWLYGGTLRPYPVPPVVRTLVNPVAKYVYRIPNDQANPENFTNSVWIELEDPDSVVIRAPVIKDQFKRYYIHSPGMPLMYNSFDRISTGQPALTLGVPVPEVAPGLVDNADGTSGLPEVISYCYTWVTQFFEEGPPSDATLITKPNNDDTVTVTLTPPTTADNTNRLLTYVRIYRTVTSTTGVASFYEVVQLPIGTTTYVDNIKDTAVANSLALASQTYTAPPIMTGIVSMPNGMLVGWKDDDLYFCEPYLPHAWPATYDLSVEYPIVGCGVFGTTLFIGTQGYPQAAQGTAPSNITLGKVEAHEPCLARGSVVSSPEGVYYASENGLILANPGLVRNITRTLISKREWVNNYDPTQLRATRFGTAYFAFICPTQPQGKGVSIDPIDQRVAFMNLASFGNVVNVIKDVWTSEVMLITNGQIVLFDPENEDIYNLGLPGPPPDVPLVWRSKEYHGLYRENYAACKVYFDEPFLQHNPPHPPYVPTGPYDLGPTQQAIIRFFADRVMVEEVELYESGSLIRLPAGFKAEIWQIEIVSRLAVLSINLASTSKELRLV
jgi:hypothetical protein